MAKVKSSSRKRLAGGKDLTNFETALDELRKVYGPFPQICIGIRDCGKETRTSKGTNREYDVQIGMNGSDFTGESLAKVVKKAIRQQQH